MKVKVLETLKLIIINYVIFAALLLTIEIIGQLSYRLLRGSFLFENLTSHFIEHPYLSVSIKPNSQIQETNASNEKVFITTNKDGYRITKNKESETGAINVICLGGSTTFGTTVSDEESWPYILQTRLGKKYNVLNLGVPGYSTLEGIIQLVTVVPELNPDIIVIYEGWNDIRSYHALPTPDYYWHGMSQKTNLQVRKKEIAEGFFLNLLAKKINRTFLADKKHENKISSLNDPYVDSLYVRNLKSIKVLCDHLKAKSIFVPQVLHVDAFANSNRVNDEWTPSISNKELPELLRKFNSLMTTSITLDDRSEVVDNILDKYKWEPKHFKDQGHFSKEGGEFFTEILMTTMKN